MRKTNQVSFNRQISERIVRSGLVSFAVTIITVFLVAYPILRTRAIQDNKNVLKAAVQRMENSLGVADEYVQSLALVVEQNEKILNYFDNPTDSNKALAELALNSLNSNHSNVRGLAICSEEGAMIDSLTNLSDTDRDTLESFFMNDFNSSSFGQSFSAVYESRVGRNVYTTTLYSRNFYIRNRWYTVLLFLSLNNLKSEIRSMAHSSLDVFYLFDGYHNHFMTQGSESNIEKCQMRAKNIASNSYESQGGNLIFVYQSVRYPFGIVSMVRLGTLLAQLTSTFLSLILAILCFLILTLFTTSASIRAAILPIINLAEHMRRAVRGHLDCKVETTRQDEIGLLERSYNKMLDDLRRSIDIISQKEAYEQRQRFSLLVSQIDPHFICNTLNSINYLARHGRDDDIVKVNTALNTILRDRLRVRDIEIMDSLSHEMEVVRQYLVIERFMYGGALQVVWDVDNSLMEQEIPKNMIQPLVENALFHGLVDEETGELNGEIRISAKVGPDQSVVLMVQDNGIGMDEETLEKTRSEKFSINDRGTKIGFSNIRGRLFYLYGNDRGLTIESEYGLGTTVSIVFPHMDEVRTTELWEKFRESPVSTVQADHEV